VTIGLQVEDLPSGLTLRARLYPDYGLASPVEELTYSGGIYSGAFEMDEPALSGHVQVWAQGATLRETIVAYSMGGNPGKWRAGGPPIRVGPGKWRAGGGFERSGNAPVVSPDGQMIFFVKDPNVFEEGEIYTVQNMSALPDLPDGKFAVGPGYNLAATPNIDATIAGSISFQYLGADALTEGLNEDGEQGLAIYFWKDGRWRALETVRSTTYNLVSAANQGPGVYALLAGIAQPSLSSLSLREMTNDQPALLTINGSNFVAPVDMIFRSPSQTYAMVDISIDGPTQFTVTVPPGFAEGEYQVEVINRYNAASSNTLPFAVYRPYFGCFYDFFSSGASRWEVAGNWGIVTVPLPDGSVAMTDSPDGSYDNAIPPAANTTTSITTGPINMTLCLPELRMRHAYVLARVGDSQDIARVEISTDGKQTWHTLASYTGGGIYGEAPLAPQDIGPLEWLGVVWQEEQIDLSGYTGLVHLRFSLTVDEYIADKGWVIDQVIIPQAAPYQVVLPLVVR
jgi:hypothetical protein